MPTFRYAVRALARSPLFTAVAIVSLALALAVNTTVVAALACLGPVRQAIRANPVEILRAS